MNLRYMSFLGKCLPFFVCLKFCYIFMTVSFLVCYFLVNRQFRAIV